MRRMLRFRRLAALFAAGAALVLAWWTPSLITQWHLREAEYWLDWTKAHSDSAPPTPYLFQVSSRITGYPPAEFHAESASQRRGYHVHSLQTAGVCGSVVFSTPTGPLKSELAEIVRSLGDEHLHSSEAMYPIVLHGGKFEYKMATGVEGLTEKVRRVKRWADEHSLEIIESVNCD